MLRGGLNLGDSTRMIARLLESHLELHQPPGLHVRALQFASQLKQGAVYDAHYLALAESFGCELWTADERFYQAASPSIANVRWLGEFPEPEQRLRWARVGDAPECGLALGLALLEIDIL